MEKLYTQKEMNEVLDAYKNLMRAVEDDQLLDEFFELRREFRNILVGYDPDYLPQGEK